MVTRWGLLERSDRSITPNEQGEVFLGNQLVQSTHVSEETSRKIEEEVRKLVIGGMDKARHVLTEHRAGWSTAGRRPARIRNADAARKSRTYCKGKRPDRPDDADPGPTSAVPVIKKKPRSEGFGGEPEPQPT